MAETTAKIRKKIYAKVFATITYKCKNDDEATRITNNFLKRRGIELVDAVHYEKVSLTRKETKVSFSVFYKVHGGWRSDFIKKMESDSIDTGVELTDVDILISRTEIPNECPRKECLPCSFARGERTSAFKSIHDSSSRSAEPDTLEETEPKQLSLWERFRGGK